jgi:hypothetical protein
MVHFSSLKSFEVDFTETEQRETPTMITKSLNSATRGPLRRSRQSNFFHQRVSNPGLWTLEKREIPTPTPTPSTSCQDARVRGLK